MDIQSEQQYDTERLRRLAKSEDYQELVRVIRDVQSELDSIKTVDKTSAEMALASSIGNERAIEALEDILGIVEQAKTGSINNSNKGDYNYT